VLGNETAQCFTIRELPLTVGDHPGTATSELKKKPLFVSESRQNEEFVGRVSIARTESLLCKWISYLAVVEQAIMSRD